ncbi:hypothetical protein M8998_03290 [Sphingobacterium sp. lm-10]|uniref:hypothetical protein n=1 Tax=Sphingobacterium sp. lm-10 TaxID=2944904 RepID=UPI002020C201|nr:hypothetical protein [Sphingobacterium sp. lm-10]MCL7986961.1 hypothetical protein [Sphingobacterium sp. lm-10]
MKMQSPTPVLKMNMLPLTIKKAFGQGLNFLTRNLLKVVPFQLDGTEMRPLADVISKKAKTLSNLPKSGNSGKDNKQSNNSKDLLSFEAGLNAIDSYLYTPFMMHMEGYRNCEIADYLSLSENQVAMIINKVRDLLQTHNSSVIN